MRMDCVSTTILYYTNIYIPKLRTNEFLFANDMEAIYQSVGFSFFEEPPPNLWRNKMSTEGKINYNDIIDQYDMV